MNKKGEAILKYSIVAVVLTINLFPIYWLIRTSLMIPKEVNAYPPNYIPPNPTHKNFLQIFGVEAYTGGVYGGVTLNAFPALLNSIITAGASTLLTMAIGLLAAYGLARFDYGGKQKNLTLWILSMQMLPPIVLAVPYFLMFNFLHLVDTRLGLILIYTTFNLPFFVWTLRQFIKELPIEIEEAALIDGCSRLDALRKVVFPLSMPAIITTLIFCFIGSWNEFLFALILTQERAKTLPFEIAQYKTGTRGTEYWNISALSLVAVIPSVILTLLIQKYIVRGLTFGAVKG